MSEIYTENVILEMDITIFTKYLYNYHTQCDSRLTPTLPSSSIDYIILISSAILHKIITRNFIEKLCVTFFCACVRLAFSPP